ncbi:MAG: hypothetical protein FWB88_12605 [Defluviitaleaceae bacterium]|nr:hypothetical protein [Defluviitaleaceae bacterium]MCL2240438.1 hypothetical protein [Defluviitaleaceae bacterium]
MNEDRKPGGKKGKAPPKKSKTGLIVIIILVVVIGGAMLIFSLNLFNLREGVLMPYLRNAPLIGNLFPPAEYEGEEIPLEQRLPRDLAEIIRTQQREIDELNAQLIERERQIREYALRIARLLPFHQYWVEYQRVSAEFNAMIARGDPDAFLNHIQYIMPEFYEQLARDAFALRQHEESVDSIVRTLSSMQESAAADILVDFRITDVILLTSVLYNMGNTMRGEILEQMDADIAAFMLRLISVAEPVMPPVAPSLFTPEVPETYEDIFWEDDIEEEEYNAYEEDDDENEV